MVAAVQDQFSVPQCQLEDELVAVLQVAVPPVAVLPVGAVLAVAIPVGVLPVEVLLVVDPWEGHPLEEAVCRVGATLEGALPVVGGVVVVVVVAQHQDLADQVVLVGVVA